MKVLIRMEWKRMVRTPGFWAALLFGVALVLWHIQDAMIDTYEQNIMWLSEQLPYDVLGMWLPLSFIGQAPSVMSIVYPIVVPLLASLPYGSSLLADRQTGYLKNLLTRADKKKVLASRYLVMFLSGGIVVAFPLVLDLLACSCFFPFYSMAPGRWYGISTSTALLGHVFGVSPVLYLILSLGLWFLFGGLWACMVPAFRGIVNNRYLILLCPFIAGYFVQTLLEIGGAAFWRFEPRVIMGGNFASTWGCAAFVVAVFLFFILIPGYMREVKDDVF